MNSADQNLFVVTGFKDNGTTNLVRGITEDHRYERVEIVQGCPPEKAHLNPGWLIDGLSESFDTFPGGADVIGDSYGALLALALACRKRMRGISQLTLIDGPLNADVDVSPPPQEFFRQFLRQYEYRITVADQCLRVLCELSQHETDKILTISSSPQDDIVPNAAKCMRLPGRSMRHMDAAERFPELTPGHYLDDLKIAAIRAIMKGDGRT